MKNFSILLVYLVYLWKSLFLVSRSYKYTTVLCPGYKKEKWRKHLFQSISTYKLVYPFRGNDRYIHVAKRFATPRKKLQTPTQLSRHETLNQFKYARLSVGEISTANFLLAEKLVFKFGRNAVLACRLVLKTGQMIWTTRPQYQVKWFSGFQK